MSDADELVRTLVLGAWLILLALTLPDFKTAPGPYCCAQTSVKDFVGYAAGLLVSALVWKLQTTIHKGIVQMWRYTGGKGTVAEAGGTGSRAPGTPPPPPVSA